MKQLNVCTVCECNLRARHFINIDTKEQYCTVCAMNVPEVRLQVKVVSSEVKHRKDDIKEKRRTQAEKFLNYMYGA